MPNYDDPYTSYWYKGSRYPTKWAAAQAAHFDGIHTNFLFDNIEIKLGGHSNFFADLDTTQEPVESWEDILRDRAQYLRDILPSINIMFSGGHDSWLMLETFLRNGIKVDKIIIERFIPKIDSKLNYEQNNLALESLKSLNVGGAEVIVSDWDDINIWEQQACDERSYYEKGLQLLPNLGDVAYQLTTQKNTKDSPVIRGTNHPRIYLQEGKYRSQMWDSDNWTGAYMYPYVVPFFTDATYPKVHLKQLHMTKNYFKLHGMLGVGEESHPQEYKTGYIKACRYTSPISLYHSPFHIKKAESYKSPMWERLSAHLTKKKVRFFSTLSKQDGKVFDKFQWTARASLGGAAISFLPSFLRVYDVPLE